jgi:hypothetical protein
MSRGWTPAKLGYGQTVYANVTLAKHNRDALQDFEKAIVERPEVLQCFSMTGSADYIIRAVVKDAAHYERFLQEVVFVNPAVQHISSHFACGRSRTPRRCRCSRRCPTAFAPRMRSPFRRRNKRRGPGNSFPGLLHITTKHVRKGARSLSARRTGPRYRHPG